MSALPPLMRDQRKIDTDEIRLLSVLHFSSAGLAVLGILMLLGHYMLFRTFFDDAQFARNLPPGVARPPGSFMDIFRWFYAFVALWFAASGVVNIISGLCMRRYRARTFSLIIAGFNCFYIPLGAVLGVFTFVVLLRDSVRELYDAQR
jgi:hypothetical protein